VIWISLVELGKCLNSRVHPLDESENVLRWVQRERARLVRGLWRIDPPLLDLLQARWSTRQTKERKGGARTPGDQIRAYGDSVPPAIILLPQRVIASLDGIEVLPHIHIFFDPPLSLLQTTREARVLREASSKDLESILQGRRRGDQIRKGTIDLTRNWSAILPLQAQMAVSYRTCFILMISWPGKWSKISSATSEGTMVKGARPGGCTWLWVRRGVRKSCESLLATSPTDGGNLKSRGDMSRVRVQQAPNCLTECQRRQQST